MLMLTAVLFISCSDNPSSVDTDGPGEVELITQVTLQLEELNANGEPNGNIVNAVWEDADGPGGDAPTVESLNLNRGVNYEGTVQLLNTTENPPEDITEEVMEEAEEHQFFYEFDSGGIQIERLDADANGLLLGINYRILVSSGAANGNLRVILLHFEDADKTSNSFPSNQTGIDTDVDIEIPVIFN